MTHERDEWLESIAAEIRDEPADDAAAQSRIMAAISGDGQAASGRDATVTATPPPLATAKAIWRWLARPRMVAVSPLAVGAVVVTLAALFWIARLPVQPARTARAPAAPPQTGSVSTRVVDFVVISPGASHVALVGDFNNWDPGLTPLRSSTREGVWVVSVPLSPGVYGYAYVIDGRLQPAEGAPRMPGQEFGGGSSVVVVGKGPA